MSEWLAEAQVRIVPNTAGFRQTLIAELTKATAGLKVQIPVLAGAARGATVAAAAQTELVAAQQAGVAAGQKLIVTNAEVANVFRAVAESAAIEEKVLRASARSALAASGAHEQLARGAGATGLSLLGARGATLAAGSSFLIGAAAVTILAKAVKGASEDAEIFARTQRLLGEEGARRAQHWSDAWVTAFGLVDDASLRALDNFVTVFEGVGVGADQSADLSKRLVEVAADLAALNNVPVDTTLRAFSLSLAGNTRGLRQFGSTLTAATVQQEALKETGKESADELTRQELVLARANLLLKEFSFASGAAADRQKNLAGQSRILKAQLDQLSDTLGNILTPAITTLVTNLNTALNVGREFIGFAKDAKNATGGLGDALGGVASSFLKVGSAVPLGPVAAGFVAFKELKGAIDGTTDSAEHARPALLGMAQGFDAAAASLAGLQQRLAAGIPFLNIRQFQNQLDTLQERATDIAIAGGDPLSNLAQQEAKARQLVDQATKESAARPRSKALQERRRQAKQDLADIIDQERQIREQRASAAQQAADEAKRAAEEARRQRQQELDRQDQDLLDRQELARGRLEIRKTEAERSESLFNDLVVARKEVVLLNAQIIEAKKIHDATLEKQTIQKLTIDLAKAQANIDDILTEQAKRAKERRQERFELAQQSIQLDIELAQTTKNVQAEIAARRRLIALDQKRMAAIKGDTIAKKQLRNEIAANRQAIKDLQKEQQQTNLAAQQLFFTFLQTQSGFAANLLSNLIPRGVAAGTVGGGAGGGAAFSTGTSTAGGGTVTATPVSQGVTAAAQQNAAVGGATTGQMATLIHLVHQLVLLQQRATGRVSRPHPEATYQTYTGSTEMNVAS